MSNEYHEDKSAGVNQRPKETVQTPLGPTRRDFGRNAALGIAAISLSATDCARQGSMGTPVTTGGLGACAEPTEENRELLIKIVNHDGEAFYELPRGGGKVCKKNTGAQPVRMTLSDDSDVDSIVVKLREPTRDLGSVFRDHPGNRGFTLGKGQGRRFVIKPTLGIKKRPDGSRCTFCTEDSEFAKLVFFTYHLSEDSPVLEHPHSPLDTDWHVEC